MRTRRHLTFALVVVAAAAGVAAGIASADSSPSAGDNQYTDPLAGVTAPKKHHAAATTTTATTPTTTASTTTVTATATATATPPSTATAPAATATTTKTRSGQIPRTGYDAWLVAALGFVLIGAGTLLRTRIAAWRPRAATVSASAAPTALTIRRASPTAVPPARVSSRPPPEPEPGLYIAGRRADGDMWLVATLSLAIAGASALLGRRLRGR